MFSLIISEIMLNTYTKVIIVPLFWIISKTTCIFALLGVDILNGLSYNQ